MYIIESCIHIYIYNLIVLTSYLRNGTDIKFERYTIFISVCVHSTVKNPMSMQFTVATPQNLPCSKYKVKNSDITSYHNYIESMF